MTPLAATLTSVALISAATVADLPRAAGTWRETLERIARQEWGVDAPVARLAAQVQQESAWRPRAVSPVGAQGLTQFMPATAAWLAEVSPSLGGPAPLDPEWALRAQSVYLRRLLAEVGQWADPCEHWAATLAAYNGGSGWVRRDRRLCQAPGCAPDRWWGNVEMKSKRSAAAFRENRQYPALILRRWEPAYLAAGWPGQGVCG